MCDFLTLKKLPLALALIKKKSIFFFTHDQKLPFFNGKFSPGIKNSKFSCKMSIFWPIDQNDGKFLFWSMPEPIVIFLGLNNYTYTSL